MSHWRKLIAEDNQVSLGPINPNHAKVVAQSSVSAQLAAVVDNVVAVSSKTVTNNVKVLQVDNNFRFKYQDVEGNSSTGPTSKLDAAKLEALVTAIEAAPEKE